MTRALVLLAEVETETHATDGARLAAALPGSAVTALCGRAAELVSPVRVLRRSIEVDCVDCLYAWQTR